MVFAVGVCGWGFAVSGWGLMMSFEVGMGVPPVGLGLGDRVRVRVRR